MSERGETNSSDDDSSSDDWIDSVEDLAEQGSPVDSRSFSPNLDHLNSEEIDFLDDQTARVLDRHSEIQKSQRQQAIQILRMNILIIGATGAAIPLLASFFRSLTFPEPVPPLSGVVSLILLFSILGLSESIAMDVISIIDSTFNILSPEKTERGTLGRLLSLIVLFGPEPEDEEAGGGVRSVSILDELAVVVDQPEQGLQREVIINRLNRIRRNERVINQNSDYLYRTYQRAKLGLERIIGIFILVVAILIVLGARI